MENNMNSLTAFSDQLVKAVAKASESTVLVNGRQRLPASGIAYTADLILTADHVVERDDNISVVITTGEKVNASIAGHDPGSDLILLRLEKSIAKLAEKAEKEAQVGQVVIALGRPSQEGIEASLGMVSSIRGHARTGRGGLLETYIRTDTTPFPGFSGGPLIDIEGKVLGLNTSGLAYGTAITIPARQAWLSAESLEKHGYVKRGYLGIRSQLVSLSPEMRKLVIGEQDTGLLLVSVESPSPAEAAGLMVGDILVAIDSHPIADHDELMIYLSEHGVGNPILIQVLRGGKPLDVKLTIGERK